MEGVGCKVYGEAARDKEENLQRAYLRIEDVVKKKVDIYLYALLGFLKENGKRARKDSLTGCRLEGGWCRVYVVCCRVWGVGCRVKVLCCRVRGGGYRVWGVGCGV